MKNNWKMKKCFIFFGIIVVLSLATIYSFPINEGANIEDPYKNNKITLKTAGYWDLTGSPIFIDDSNPSFNWSKTAEDNDWCSGNGTWNEPYLIEDVTIDGQDTDTCITILNSKTAYFVIRNCTIYNSLGDIGNGGIKLENANNGILINNTCTQNRAGIYLFYNSNNNTILENRLIDNSLAGGYLKGVLSVGCGGNKISNNTMINNGQYGLLVEFSSNSNNITNNIIRNNGWKWNLEENSGIKIHSSADNIVSDNEITNNQYNGVYLYESSTLNNIIINNTISENKKGIRMAYNVFSNDVIDNLIKDNTEYGIYISTYHPGGNDFYLNRFIDNGIQAYDNDMGEDNNWDNGTIGNFWSDYPGVDADDNGIGDTPYLIGGDNGGNQDNYPIWHDSPNIEIHSPQPSEIFESTAPIFNVTITDPNLESMWYTLNNGMQKIPFLTNESINQTLWDSLFDGPIVITFYANDSVGNENSSSVTVIRDTAAPDIHINNPKLNEVWAHTPPAFNVEIRDYLLNATWYTVQGGLTKYFFTSNESLNTEAWNNAVDGIVIFTFCANDTLGKERNKTVYVYKDTTDPTISIISPEHAAIYSTTAPTFIVEYYDANPVNLWYTINDSLTEYTFYVNGSINQAAWDGLPEGFLILRFYVEDIAGYNASDFVGIYKTLAPTDGDGDGDGDTTLPDIAGYPLVLLITTIWVMSTILIVFIKRNIKKK